MKNAIQETPHDAFIEEMDAFLDVLIRRTELSMANQLKHHFHQ